MSHSTKRRRKMKQTISKGQFIDQFKTIRPENFTYEGLDSLFDYFEQLEEDTGQEIELDVIGICCDYSEYGSVEECLSDYDLGDINELHDNTTVIELSSGVIIQSF